MVRANIRCQVCRGKHHTSICEGRSHIPVMDTAVTSSLCNTYYIHSYVYKYPHTSITSNCNMCSNQSRNARTQEEVQLILDGGSQRSYIMHQLRRALAEAVEAIHIKTFGSRHRCVRLPLRLDY